MSDPAAEAVSGAARLAATLATHRRALTADVIEQAALNLLLSRPMENVTVEQIAAAAGVSVRNFYRYYSTKEMIVVALPLRLSHDIAAQTALRPEQEAPFVALRAAVRGMSTETNEYLRLWQRATAKSYGNEKITQLVVSVTGPVLTEALAARCGLAADELWPELAGVTAATALAIGARRWALQHGSLRSHLCDALDLVGRGLDAPPAG